jgi:3-dehydroquinate synthase
MNINSHPIRYEIQIGQGVLSTLKERLKGRRFAIVTDDTVWHLHGGFLLAFLGGAAPGAAEKSGFSPEVKKTTLETLSVEGLYSESEADLANPRGLLSITVIPNGESSKNIDHLLCLYQDFIRAGLTRQDVVLAFGGGVIGDLAGYAAASYLRGVSFIQIPTTLLAMVDSSIGGKVAIDLPEGKNLVGAFHQPEAVLIDPRFLDTLPVRQLRDGIAEMVKAAFIRDEALLTPIQAAFGELPKTQENQGSDQAGQRPQTLAVSEIPGLDQLIERALTIKKVIVEADEKESGDRKLLNFGHTLGHAAESRGGYSALTHGEGVALGMQWITRCSEARGLSMTGTADLVQKTLETLGFEAAESLKFETLKDWVLRDKKKTDTGLEVILIDRPGKGYVYTLNTEDIDGFFGTS